MSINKFAASLATAGLLVATSAVNAVAESEGWFVGGYLAQRGTTVESEVEASSTLVSYSTSSSGSASGSGMKYGLVFGKLFAIGDAMGWRAYAAGDLGDSTTNINANADFLYTFAKTESVEFRGFAGAWLGYASHDVSGGISGFDAGINAGVRAVFGEKHGVELFGHFGFLSQDKEISTSTWGVTSKTTFKISQPYQIGLRYTFTF